MIKLLDQARNFRDKTCMDYSSSKRRGLFIGILLGWMMQLVAAPLLAETSDRLGIPTYVFQIIFNGFKGAAFTIVVDDRQYLITAKHVVPGITNGSEVYLRRKEGNYEAIKVRIIRCESTNVDIIVLAPITALQPIARIPLGADRLALGQEIFFFGFPLDYYNTAGAAIFPFVGKGIVSAADTRDPKAVLFFFHAMNVKGFSGGPIVFKDEQTHEARIFGVVQGFAKETWPVLKEKKETGMEVESNSGIMTGYPIDSAVEAIRKNPIGPSVK